MRLPHVSNSILSLAAVLPLGAYGATYCVDANAGDDTKPGSQAAPWKSLNKVNNTVFLAGDRILFKAGCKWTGQLHQQGSGAPGKPIVIDCYGSGVKPTKNGDGWTGSGTVYLFIRNTGR